MEARWLLKILHQLTKRKKYCQLIFLALVMVMVVLFLKVNTGTQSRYHGNSFPLKQSPIYPSQLSPASEIRHVAFLKVHKAGSSTVLNIIYRFGFRHNLTFVLPMRSNYLGGSGHSIDKRRILPPAKNHRYDLLCNHVIFNKTVFGYYMPKDTVYIAIVRNPYERFRSAYYYFRNVYSLKYLAHNRGLRDHFEQFILHQDRYEPINPYTSYTNNRMTLDLGFPAHDLKNTSKLREYLRELDATFGLVMVTERFDESVILLKRMLNWTFKDVLYVQMNSLKYKPKTNVNATLMNKAREFLRADYVVYDFFVKILESKIKQQPPDFIQEVKNFKNIRKNVEYFCLKSKESDDKTYFQPSTPWSAEFTITFNDCKLIKMEELRFLNKLVTQQMTRLRETGANNEFYKTIPSIRYSRKDRYLLKSRLTGQMQLKY